MGAGQCEFFSGTTELFNFLKVQNPSIVTTITNLDMSADAIINCKKQNGPQCIKAWDVIVRNGRKIGVLGFVPNDIFDIATPGDSVSLVDYKTAASAAIAAMKSVHSDVNIIIATSTLNHAQNEELAESAEGAEIDVIIGGGNASDGEGKHARVYGDIMACQYVCRGVQIVTSLLCPRFARHIEYARHTQ